MVSCGKRKIWDRYPRAGPTKAKDVYVGAPFKVYSEYAKKFSNRWIILSAKYGFIDPDFMIPENYNATFKDQSSNPIGVRELEEQIRRKALDVFDTAVVLGGHDYADIVSIAFSDLEVKIKKPVTSLPLGRAMGTVRKAINEGRPLDC